VTGRSALDRAIETTREIVDRLESLDAETEGEMLLRVESQVKKLFDQTRMPLVTTRSRRETEAGTVGTIAI